MEEQIRILIAKPDLDGHDRGAKIICFTLLDAGMKVFYSGLHKSVNEIIEIAKHNSVNIIGLSIMTGAHLSICNKCIEKIKKENILNIKLIIGGVIPKADIPKLIKAGAVGVFPNGTKLNIIIESIKALFTK